MNLKDWIGRTETVDDIVTAMPYAALSASLDQSFRFIEIGRAHV